LSAKPEETKAKTARRTEENFILDLSQEDFETPVDDNFRKTRPEGRGSLYLLVTNLAGKTNLLHSNLP
jgi:hypothetical protein